MQLSQVATFCQVVAQQSFSGAAARLGITKSTASRQVAAARRSDGAPALVAQYPARLSDRGRAGTL